ncbi:hypothetical protein ACLOJK_013874 [Asimina triloba]
MATRTILFCPFSRNKCLVPPGQMTNEASPMPKRRDVTSHDRSRWWRVPASKELVRVRLRWQESMESKDVVAGPPIVKSQGAFSVPCEASGTEYSSNIQPKRVFCTTSANDGSRARHANDMLTTSCHGSCGVCLCDAS